MRSFQLIFLLVFIVLFLLITFGTYKNLKTILPKNSVRKLNAAVLIFHALVLLTFIFLYIYPNQPREASGYKVYALFNVVLFALFIFNLPNAFFYLLYRLFTPGKSPVIPYMGFFMGVSIVLAMLFGTVVGSRQVKTVHQELYFPNLPAQFDGYTIFLFTDAHLGNMLFPKPLLNHAIRVVDELHPDLVLFAGDLVNNFAYETDGFKPLFQQITGNRKSFSILGNHDYGDYTNWESEAKKEANFQAILDANREFGFNLLRNEHVVLKKGSDSIFLAGVENWGHPPFPQYADLDSALQRIPTGAFILLLTHDPAHWESKVKNERRVQLSFSGHTHGMQWGIKLAGIPFSLAYLTRKNWGGLYRNGINTLYVNTGFGTVGVPWRLDMPAEFTLFTLKRGQVN